MNQDTNIGTNGRELTVKEIVQLSGWLSAHAEEMRVSNREDRCDAIHRALGLMVSVSQLARIERELGFVFKRRREGTNIDRLSMLAHAIARLHQDMGSTPPTFVTQLARHRSAEEIQASYEAWKSEFTRTTAGARP